MSRFIMILLAGCCLSGGLLASPAQAGPPLIEPHPLSIFAQQQCLTEAETDYCADLRLELDTTGLPWLDFVLLQQLSLTDPNCEDDAATSCATTIAEDAQTLQQQLQQNARTSLAEQYAEIQAARAADDPYSIQLEHHDNLRFIAQRHQLASFKQFTYNYSGGAHGMYYTRYLLFDLMTRQQLQLDDLLLAGVRPLLFQALRQHYQQDYADYVENWLNGTEAEQQAALLTDNFIFDAHGLNFSYPLYALAPYAAGEVRLSLSYYELSDILKPEYLIQF